MTQTRLRQTNWNREWFWRFLLGQKLVFLKHLWNENFAYIACISLRPSLAGNSVICFLFLDFVRFAIRSVIIRISTDWIGLHLVLSHYLLNVCFQEPELKLSKSPLTIPRQSRQACHAIVCRKGKIAWGIGARPLQLGSHDHNFH